MPAFDDKFLFEIERGHKARAYGATVTPRSLPIPYVAPAAIAPIPSMRKPLKKKLRPVKSDINPPTVNNEAPHAIALAMKAAEPVVTRYGITGIAAPHANAMNELAAAVQGEPSADGSR